jgi:transcriptional regulator
MYVPPAFREDRLNVLHDLIGRYPLGLLITAGTQGLIANPLPFLLKEDGANGVLQAHLARANNQVEALREGTEALVVFQGADAYVTPSWYAAKAEHGRVVPTWNYVTVQVRGRPSLIEDAGWVRQQIDALTAVQEKDRTGPWQVSDAPEAYIDAQLRAIIGIEIPITQIDGKVKASQNRSDIDRQRVAEGLRENGEAAMADLVWPPVKP